MSLSQPRLRGVHLHQTHDEILEMVVASDLFAAGDLNHSYRGDGVFTFGAARSWIRIGFNHGRRGSQKHKVLTWHSFVEQAW
jgi:hypothetical protein